MKKATCYAGILLAAVLMLLPVMTGVNHSFGKPSSTADGCPLPPPIPDVKGAAVVIADGCPLPPPIPDKVAA